MPDSENPSYQHALDLFKKGWRARINPDTQKTDVIYPSEHFAGAIGWLGHNDFEWEVYSIKGNPALDVDSVFDSLIEICKEKDPDYTRTGHRAT